MAGPGEPPPVSARGIALITGASQGIGYETARQLAGRGWTVFLTARDPAAGQAAAHGLRDVGDVRFAALDVTDADSINRAVGTVVAVTEHLDVLVNNAAVYPDGTRTMLDMDRDAMVATFVTNTVGPLAVAQAFVPMLARSPRGGRIVNVSSGAGALSEMETTAPSYSVSKTALNAVTVQLSHLLASRRISVNSMCPGWVRTDMGGPDAPRSVDEGANTVVWLAADAPAELTGKFLRDRQVIDW